MKTGAPSSGDHETAAFEWATDFFRSCAPDMTASGSHRAAMEFGVKTLVSGYDAELRNHPKDLDSRMAGFVERLNGDDLLPLFAAALLERGDRLPKPLMDFVVAFLRDPGKSQTGRPGRKRSTLTIRDSNIGAAVGFVAAKWKISPTRNSAQKNIRACAASIVRDALAKGAGVHLSEADVAKAWVTFRRQMTALGRMTVGNGELQIVTRDFLVGRIDPN